MVTINEINRKIKVAIIEDNWDLCNTVNDYLIMKSNFEIVGIAYEGESGLKLLKENEVDVVLLDIILPLLDGISILEYMQDLKGAARPAFIMFTAISAEVFTNRALELGADYFILKPFDLELLVRRIEQIYNFKKKKTTEMVSYEKSVFSQVKVNTPTQYAINCLRWAGISPNLKEYTYLKYAILLGIENKAILNSITGQFYPAIAQEYNTTSSCVERAIRHCIGKAWLSREKNDFYKLLGYATENTNKPTNGSFMRSIIEFYDNSQYQQL